MTCHREKNTSTSARSREVVILGALLAVACELIQDVRMKSQTNIPGDRSVDPGTQEAVGKLDYTSAQHGGLKGSSKKHQETMLSRYPANHLCSDRIVPWCTVQSPQPEHSLKAMRSSSVSPISKGSAGHL
jgi:hypothetical protein